MTKLQNIGVPIGRISIIMSEHARELVPKVRSAAPEVAVAAGGIGALVGGLAAVASLALPGVGVLAAGPIAAALGGGTVGAASGGLVGALIGFGIPEPQAKQYAEAVLNDGLIVAVHPTSATMAENVETLFKATRGVRMEHVERTTPAKVTKPIRDAFDSPR